MLILKENPVGVDFVIDKIQKRLELRLPFETSVSEIYPRAYKNPKAFKSNVLIPELHTIGNDYKEAFFDDRLPLMVYFLVNDTQEVNRDGLVTSVISVIVHANLSMLYPSATSRQDEELHMEFMNALTNWMYKVQSIETGIRNVYREFDITRVLLDDMSNQHVFRINLNATWQVTCCKNC